MCASGIAEAMEGFRRVGSRRRYRCRRRRWNLSVLTMTLVGICGLNSAT